MNWIPPKDALFPLLGRDIKKHEFVPVVAQENKQYSMQTNQGLAACIEDQIKSQAGQWGFGGYLEERNIYRRSAHFDGSDDEVRSIHLGLDIWGPAGTRVFTPMTAVIHSFQYNAAPFDYGATIILKHEWNGVFFYSLYGHLSREDLKGIEVGDQLEKGSPFCHFGSEEDNGGWVPHLHFQLILEIGTYKGDYPGVVKPSEKEYYANNCPDPSLLWRTPE
jgi:murein DD-endopeptidase MepM/ murein hydrolase activator NlpD